LEMVSGRYRFVAPDPLTPNPSPPSTGARGGRQDTPPGQETAPRLLPSPPLRGRGAGGEGGAPPPGTPSALQPRRSGDRTRPRPGNGRLALPGTQSLALVSGGTIPDTGQYAVYTGNDVRIGELDEEFVYERRVGDVFLLGTTPWRLERVEADRVFVTPAEAAP